tara:strand:- start:149 stop:304 length:156 start_codon:yes stop_codon:yes gene_type:complete
MNIPTNHLYKRKVQKLNEQLAHIQELKQALANHQQQKQQQPQRIRLLKEWS